jgi:hypothetical protein
MASSAFLASGRFWPQRGSRGILLGTLRQSWEFPGESGGGFYLCGRNFGIAGATKQVGVIESGFFLRRAGVF